MIRLKAVGLVFMGLFAACSSSEKKKVPTSRFELTLLGVAQDGGCPQAGCEKPCCSSDESGSIKAIHPTCLALYDRTLQQVYFFEATPAFAEQWRNWKNLHPEYRRNVPDAFFITHAHIGHYTGLMDLGREVMGSSGVPVYVLPRMAHFLENNGPWSQLNKLGNISIQRMQNDSVVRISDSMHVKPFVVPHRDEFSETAGFHIKAGNKNILFIPDIDKWHLWSKDIKKEIQQCDLAFVDATFYKNGELKRDMSEIPHPFVEESMRLFETLSAEDKSKVHFIHFNHTNPLIRDVQTQEMVLQKGFRVSEQEQTFSW